MPVALVLMSLPTGCSTTGGQAMATSAAKPSSAPKVFRLTELPNGSCLADDRFLRPDGAVVTVDCARPHMYRTYASTDLPADMRDGPFPGYQKVYDFTLKFCDVEFAKLHKGLAGKDGRPVEYLIAPMEKVQWRPEEKRVVCATVVTP
ncbi:hypothetical protein ACFQU9_20865 [Actinomadura namibiensis]|uniref:Septum formation-related domain-containing protein n=1 Tax=Actinomadura namibiensis TaxID=182080 RepID=A0A7W3LQW6_ACTNM|nr:hypothetical protein [Actinomadura namibiensis]MBA8952629.1 hypothetical protein [Actinomadura namibiensis]